MVIHPRAPRGARHPLWRALAPLALALVLTVTVAGCAVPQLPPTLTGVSADGKSVTAPARIRHGANGATLVIVDLVINGKGPYPFALDTGASLSLIDLQLARRLDLRVAGPPEDITGVGGTERVTPVSIERWAMGAATLPASTITSAPLNDLRHSAGIDGLLGSDILSAFNSVTIDYAHSAIIITPPA